MRFSSVLHTSATPRLLQHITSSPLQGPSAPQSSSHRAHHRSQAPEALSTSHHAPRGTHIFTIITTSPPPRLEDQNTDASYSLGASACQLSAQAKLQQQVEEGGPSKSASKHGSLAMCKICCAARHDLQKCPGIVQLELQPNSCRCAAGEPASALARDSLGATHGMSNLWYVLTSCTTVRRKGWAAATTACQSDCTPATGHHHWRKSRCIYGKGDGSKGSEGVLCGANSDSS